MEHTVEASQVGDRFVDVDGVAQRYPQASRALDVRQDLAESEHETVEAALQEVRGWVKSVAASRMRAEAADGIGVRVKSRRQAGIARGVDGS